MHRTIYYWGPFTDRNVATKKAIYNSAKAINQYSKEFKAKIINAIGEWKDDEILSEKDLFYNTSNKIFEYLPRFGWIKSRLSYLIIFIKGISFK